MAARTLIAATPPAPRRTHVIASLWSVMLFASLLAAPPALAQDAPAAPAIVIELTPPSADAPADTQSGSVFFVGAATVILRYAGFTILTDPNFLQRGEQAQLGYGITSTRLTEPAMRIDQLPPIDLVVLSHYHGDHFDQRVQNVLDRKVAIVSTPHAVRQLRKLGFTATHALKPWQSLELRKGDSRLRVTAMPGRHGPAGGAHAMPPVMGSMLDFLHPQGGSRYRVYISGDTLVYDDLEDIPQRYPHVDLALLHLGGARMLGMLVSMDAAHGLQALRLIQPERAIPIHHDDYTVFKSPLSDFLAMAGHAGWADRVTVLKRGEAHHFKADGHAR